MKAVENSATIIGLRCIDGVILASEKLVASELHVAGDNSRIFKVFQYLVWDYNICARLTITLVWYVLDFCLTLEHLLPLVVMKPTTFEVNLVVRFPFRNYATTYPVCFTPTQDTTQSGQL